MPIYEYVCQSCGERQEVLQRLGAGPEGLTCSACGGDRLERALSVFAASAGAGTASGATASCGAPGCGSGFT